MFSDAADDMQTIDSGYGVLAHVSKYVTKRISCNMVCAKCQKLQRTMLATPGVKRKNDMYYGSPTAGGGEKSKSSSTQGPTGIGKSKLLSKSAKNPYAAYASSCSTCKTKTEEGRKYCQRCAYKANGQFAFA
ncbi:hypothetical protein G7Y79_00019g047100 [Physcia stellaris]|nr:hypothetical protein G7Y79_00019g047100 [Physcia stellaris]